VQEYDWQASEADGSEVKSAAPQPDDGALCLTLRQRLGPILESRDMTGPQNVDTPGGRIKSRLAFSETRCRMDTRKRRPKGWSGAAQSRRK